MSIQNIGAILRRLSGGLALFCIGCSVKHVPANFRVAPIPDPVVVQGAVSITGLSPVTPGARPLLITISNDPLKMESMKKWGLSELPMNFPARRPIE